MMVSHSSMMENRNEHAAFLHIPVPLEAFESISSRQWPGTTNYKNRKGISTMSISRLTGCIASCGLVFVSLSGSARAAESCTTVVGHLVSVEGRIEIQHSTAPAWSSGALNDALCPQATSTNRELSIAQAVFNIFF